MTWAALLPWIALTGHTVVNAALLRRPPRGATTERRVAVLLPLRDEAERVTPCLEALLGQRGVPRLDIAPKIALATIEGSVPAPHEFGSGCRFVGRCPLARERCRNDPPPLSEQGGGHQAACWYPDEVANLRRTAA